MKIDAALLPHQRYGQSHSVCILVDVLRASSSIVTLFERGCTRVVAAANVDEARDLARRFPDHLLCGEKNGLPPEGFHYGNSPAEFSKLDLAGRSAVLATSNGTRVLAALGEAPAVLVGCLLNRTAVARAAVDIAQREGLDIAVVCSAAYGGSTFVLEDALGAGAIVDAALSLGAGVVAADAARFCRDAFTAVGEIAAAVASAYHARELEEEGLGSDVAFCGRVDASAVAPVLHREADGLLLLRPYEG